MSLLVTFLYLFGPAWFRRRYDDHQDRVLFPELPATTPPMPRRGQPERRPFVGCDTPAGSVAPDPRHFTSGSRCQRHGDPLILCLINQGSVRVAEECLA